MTSGLLSKSELQEQAARGRPSTQAKASAIACPEADVSDANVVKGGSAATAQSLHDKQQNFFAKAGEVARKPAGEVTKEDAAEVQKAEVGKYAPSVYHASTLRDVLAGETPGWETTEGLDFSGRAIACRPQCSEPGPLREGYELGAAVLRFWPPVDTALGSDVLWRASSRIAAGAKHGTGTWSISQLENQKDYVRLIQHPFASITMNVSNLRQPKGN
ncbi:uncharacterized protein JN550_004314 [Neoarthrinium moseri]|uniref:uncharacterized protein n=1 Tax=Neoarthrinium moseri TaxID=1658444 RepID=UPI001FDB4A2F|nr:uncharacterized protein JN550_004314 [Neoarthrinium moseri]KAI1872111.1 hypothetical protein JN550_004314 [Neoarthrinium moseri]